jgi:hypothetical protein
MPAQEPKPKKNHIGILSDKFEEQRALPPVRLARFSQG